MARNRVEVGPVETPIETFSGEDNTLRSVSIVNGMDVVGTNLTVDKMTPVVEYPYTEDSVEQGGSHLGRFSPRHQPKICKSAVTALWYRSPLL